MLAGCLLNEGARESLSRQVITPARYDEGTLDTYHNATAGERDTIILAHPKGPYMKIHGIIRRELNQSGEFGEWIEDAALHNALPHL